jgi:hypothetical protein
MFLLQSMSRKDDRMRSFVFEVDSPVIDVAYGLREELLKSPQILTDGM